MNMVRQILAVTLINFMGLRDRVWPSSVIVIGIGCTVAVIVSIFSLTTGIARSYAVGTPPGRVIVLASGAQRETASHLSPDTVNFVTNVPGIAKASDGSPIADGEVVGSLPVNRKVSGLNGSVLLRGLGPKGLAMRPKLHIVSGRLFRPGANEAMVGIGAQRQFLDLAVGQGITLQHGRWPIVGVFEAGGDIIEGQLIGDARTVMAAIGHKGYSSVIADLSSPEKISSFKRDLAGRPQFKVISEKQSDYYARATERFAGFFNTVAYVLGAVMAVGAVFGTINTLYSAVSARTREIATFRMLGFSSVAIAVSVIVESVSLALLGAITGGAAAWLLFNGQQKVVGSTVFNLTISIQLLETGIVCAIAIAIIGAALPSINAARIGVTEGLRAA